jgi:hypothetical protein
VVEERPEVGFVIPSDAVRAGEADEHRDEEPDDESRGASA